MPAWCDDSDQPAAQRGAPDSPERRSPGEMPTDSKLWPAQGPYASPPGWPAEWTVRRRRVMGRLALLFLFLALLLSAALVGVGLLVFRLSGPGLGPAEATLILCSLPPTVLIFLLIVGGLTFRRYGSPLAEMMAAADAVAGGDLSARVGERGRGDMARLARRFNRMTAELQRAEQARRNLTADVAHELRTPLQIIQGNLEGALDGVYEPTPEHLRATLDETRRLGRLVGDLQTLSLAESGQLPLYPRAVDAADLLEDVALRFMAQAAESGVTLKVHADSPLPLSVDPDRLEQVLSNLTANALRHTPAGGRVTLAARAGGDGVELSVSDTGEGIPAADLPYVFDRFWRGDRARGRATGGSGLGLAIARQLVRAHGGAIRATSEPGAGTTFTIALLSQPNNSTRMDTDEMD